MFTPTFAKSTFEFWSITFLINSLNIKVLLLYHSKLVFKGAWLYKT